MTHVTQDEMRQVLAQQAMHYTHTPRRAANTELMEMRRKIHVAKNTSLPSPKPTGENY